MNMIIEREHEVFHKIDGIFGEMFTEDLMFFCHTLEHAYPNENGVGFFAKIPAGDYLCKRRFSPKFQCDVFEIMDVPGHDFIEIHIANYNEELDGCIAPGLGLGKTLNGGRMLTSSKKAFDALMELQKEVDSFLLKIK